MKKTLSLFISLLFVFFSFTCAVEASDKKIVSDGKLSSELKEKIETMDATEKISVSVWFIDIQIDDVKTNVIRKLTANENISDDAIQRAVDLAFYDVEASTKNLADIYSLTDTFEDVTVEDVQMVIAAEREVASEMYQEHNQNIINHLFSYNSDVFSTKNPGTENSLSYIDYVCRYAPNANMTLTKAQILDIENSENVIEINYIEDNSDYYNLNDVEPMSNYDEDDEPYDMTAFNVSGLATARDVWGLNGYGMNVGMVESNGYPMAFDTNATVERVYSSSSSTPTSLHASLVANIMVGLSYKDDGTLMFKGAIPNANLFTADITGEGYIKAAVEALLDENVSAINCSFSYPELTNIYNTYGDTAKWYDHISVQHNVHLILSASNYGSLGVKPTNTSYNAIVVGACNNNGLILADSSYITNNNFMNKPDLVAPGSNINCPVYGGSGTSFAAPMVTSAVIQLSQASSVLLSNPTLMKALLLSSSTITDHMNISDVISIANGTNIAISKQYGTGMLNVTNAYSSFINNGYYKTGSMPSTSTGVSYSKNLSKVKGKTVRVCLTWDKMNTISGSHTSGNVSSAMLDTFKLTVTTPSGAVYSSQYSYDNKQIVSFVATENGTYTFNIYRFGTGNSGQVVDYSLAYSVQS